MVTIVAINAVDVTDVTAPRDIPPQPGRRSSARCSRAAVAIEPKRAAPGNRQSVAFLVKVWAR